MECSIYSVMQDAYHPPYNDSRLGSSSGEGIPAVFSLLRWGLKAGQMQLGITHVGSEELEEGIIGIRTVAGTSINGAVPNGRIQGP